MLRVVIIFIFCFSFQFSHSQEKDTTLLRLQQEVKLATTDSLKVDAILNLNSHELLRDYLNTEYRADSLRIAFKEKKDYNITQQLATVYQQLGVVNRKKSNFAKSLDYYFKAKKVFESINDSSSVSTSYHNIAVVYRFQNEYEKSIEYFRKSIALKKILKRTKSIGSSYNMLGVSYSKMKQQDSAMFYYNKSEEIFKKVNYTEGLFQVLGNKAVEFSKNKEHKKSIALKLKALEYAESIGKLHAIATINYNLSRSYINLKDYKNALIHIEKVIALTKNQQMKYQLGNAYRRRSNIYHKLEQHENAFYDYVKYSKIFDTIFNIKKTKEIKALELRQERLQLEKEKQEIELKAQAEAWKKRLYLFLLIIAIFLFTILGYFALRYFKARWKKAELAKQALREQLQLNEKETEERLSTLNKEVGTLSTEIDSKREEIRTLMAESLKFLKTKEKLVEDLKGVSKETSNTSLKGIIADLKSDALEDSKLVLIKNNLDALNFDFYKAIKKKHPNLSKTDIEICSYIKLGLERKAIAKLRNTSVEAVKKSRYRLRKKMDLPTSRELDNYIQSI